MTVIAAEIGGVFVPLDQCAWTMNAKCGCVLAAVMAQVAGEGGWVLVTEQEAHAHLNESEYVRQVERDAGITFRLVRANGVGLWNCGKHEPRKVRNPENGM